MKNRVADQLRPVLETLVIDRSRWLRGDAGEESVLYSRKTRKQCCLGFVARSCGLKVADILNIDTPDNTRKKTLWPKAFVNTRPHYDGSGNVLANTTFTQEAMRINDDVEITGRERERQLRNLFAKEGIKVKFVGRASAKKSAPAKKSKKAKK